MTFGFVDVYALLLQSLLKVKHRQIWLRHQQVETAKIVFIERHDPGRQVFGGLLLHCKTEKFCGFAMVALKDFVIRLKSRADGREPLQTKLFLKNV